MATTRTVGLVRSVLCSACRVEIIGRCNYCWNCGTRIYRGQPIPRDPAAPIVRIDVKKLNARRATVRAVMAGRPGQRRKSKIVDKFDAFVRVGSGGCKGWATAEDEGMLD